MSDKPEDATFNTKLFSGVRSEKMWADINKAESVEDLREALYFVCCQLQTLEYKLAPLFEKLEEYKPNDYTG